MNGHSRRRFLADVGRGMLVASVGTSLANDLGSRRLGALSRQAPPRLDFGKLEPLVALMQETPPDKLHADPRRKARRGHRASHARRRRGAGQRPHLWRRGLCRLPLVHGPGPGLSDGASELPTEQARCQCSRCSIATRTAFRPLAAGQMKCCTRSRPPSCRPIRAMMLLQQATRQADLKLAEQTFAALARGPIGEAFNHLAVLHRRRGRCASCRALVAGLVDARFDRPGICPDAAAAIGPLLREFRAGMKKHNGTAPAVRTVLRSCSINTSWCNRPLATAARKTAGSTTMGRLIASASREQAADAVAAALAEGIAAEDVGAAISLAANELVLRDPGRAEAMGHAGKTGRQRARRFGRRSRLRCGERLAKHRPRLQSPQCRGQPDRRRVSYGRSIGPA